MARQMNQLFRLQFLGPLAIFAATLCAELAAWALQYAPSSQLLWFINLKLFGIFQRSHAALSEIVPIEGFQFFGLALPIFVLACCGLATKSRRPFTVATHFSAAYACFLVLSWQVGVPEVKQASIGHIVVPSGIELYVTSIIFGSCLMSFAITHVLYLQVVRQEIRALIRIL